MNIIKSMCTYISCIAQEIFFNLHTVWSLFAPSPTDSNDFLLSSLDFLIPKGIIPRMNAACVTITALEDPLVEGDHEFHVEITSTNNSQVSYPEPTISITIVDNDGTYTT